MKLLTIIFAFLFSSMHLHAQISNVQEEFPLPASLSESSGAILLNGKLITHNDSGGQLYELDLNTELVTRTVTISNATNVDWEDLAQDDNYIYIADIGNNNGDRTDLKIYKILKSDFNNSTTVTAEIINFSYINQTDFSSNPQNTEWDAEALLSLNTSHLVLISKNWVNNISSAYLISKIPGTYGISPLPAILNSGGLITGATFNTLSGKIYLVGYTPPVLPSPLQPFIWECEGFTGDDVFSGTNTQTSIASTFSFEQIEAITFVNEASYYVTSETFSISILSDYAKLLSFSTSDVTLSSFDIKSEEDGITLFPNPVKSILEIKGDHITSIEIFNTQSAQLHKGIDRKIDMSVFSDGVYLVKVNFPNKSIKKRVVKL